MTTHAILEDTFWSDPKWRAIARDLSVPTLLVQGLITKLWSWTLTHGPDGVLSDHDPRDIAFALEWEGDVGRLFEVLIKHQAIDDTDLGWEIHGWMKRCPKFKKAQDKRAQRLIKKQDLAAKHADRAFVATTAIPTLETTDRSSLRSGSGSGSGSGAEREDARARESIVDRPPLVLAEAPPEPAVDPETEYIESRLAAYDSECATVIDISPRGERCSEEAFLALWDELCAGQGRVRAQIVLTGIERALLAQSARPEVFWRNILTRVAESEFLRGERTGFVATIEWVLKHSEQIRSGRYASGPPIEVRRDRMTAAERQIEEGKAWVRELEKRSQEANA